MRAAGILGAASVGVTACVVLLLAGRAPSAFPAGPATSPVPGPVPVLSPPTPQAGTDDDGPVVDPLPGELSATVGVTTVVPARRVSGGLPPFVVALEGDGQARLSESGALVVTTTRPGRSGPYRLRVTDALGRSSTTETHVLASARIALSGRAADVAVVGTPYHARFVATGGRPPYAWTFSGSPLPGLSFVNGVLSGVPTQPGRATGLVVTVVDADNRQAYSGAFSVEAVAEAPAEAPPETLEASVGDSVVLPLPDAGDAKVVSLVVEPVGSVRIGPDGRPVFTAVRTGDVGPFVVRSGDSVGRTWTRRVVVRVGERMDVVVPSFPPLMVGVEGVVPGPRVAGGRPPYVFGLADASGTDVVALPGMYLVPGTGMMFGTPRAGAAVTARYKVVDATGRSALSAPVRVDPLPLSVADAQAVTSFTVDGTRRCAPGSSCQWSGEGRVVEARLSSPRRVSALSFPCEGDADGVWETHDGSRWSPAVSASGSGCSVSVRPVVAVAVRWRSVDDGTVRVSLPGPSALRDAVR